MMKARTLLSAALAIALATPASAQNAMAAQNAFGQRTASQQLHMALPDGQSILLRPTLEDTNDGQGTTVDEILGCPEGTVFGVSDADYTMIGNSTADMGRPNYGMSFYQSFSGNYYKVNGLRFIGLFKYFDYDEYNWFYCSDRAGMDDDGEISEPIAFEIGFYRMGDDGMPGEEVYKKTISILGKKTAVYLGDEVAGYGYLYEFQADLGEDIALESGYFSVGAADMGDQPTCWFNMFNASSSAGAAYYKFNGSDDYSATFLPALYCFKGNGDMAAQKALKLERLLAPKSVSDGRHARVSVEVVNIGEDDIKDATLQLYVDGQLLATETLNTAIASQDAFKYTFAQRVDLTQEGTHTITIKNVTPADEHLAAETLSQSFTRTAGGEVGESYGRDFADNYTTRVVVGDIDNTSEGSAYSDFTSQKTSIAMGQQLTLDVYETGYGYIGAWVDWDGDGSFSDAEQASLSYATTESGSRDYNHYTGTLAIPSGLSVKPGDKRLRIVNSYYTPVAVGAFSYGETEDYTISVVAGAADPVITTDCDYVEGVSLSHPVDAVINVSNTGNATLTADVTKHYVLPDSPTGNLSWSSKAPAQNKPVIAKAPAATVKTAKAATDDATEYVLRYDSENSGTVGLSNYAEATYAAYYPGSMVKALKGMHVSSVDVYVGDVPTSSSIVVYGQKDQTHAGSLISEQAFTPVETSWNHVVLDTPVEIGDQDLWIGVKMSGFQSGDYNIGIDDAGAVIGYGDLVNVGGDTWWSMADLGFDSNYNIRANVTGERTPAIEWLSIDQSSLSVDPGKEQPLTVTMNPKDLYGPLYEAYVEIASNDPLCPTVKTPVYLIVSTATGIYDLKTADAQLRFADGRLTVSSAAGIRSVTISDLSGRTLSRQVVGGTEATVQLTSLASGVVVMTVEKADGSRYAVKFPNVK